MVKSEVLDDLKNFVYNYVKTHYEPIIVRPDFEEWLDGTDNPQHRKDELRRAHEENQGQLPPEHACQRVKNFIKLEDYPFYKHARWINSRSDRFKVFCGPFFKKIEEVVYAAEGDVKFIKHIPVADRPKVLESIPKGMSYYGTDFTSFEKHFTKEIMQAIEFVLYDYMLPCMTKLEKECLFNTLSGYNRLKSRLGFKAVVKARRMSGEMCTSLGNGFTNMMLALYLAHIKNGHIYGYVEGDDGIFATDFPLLAEDYKKLGFEIKIISHERISDASFCGMIFADAGEIIRCPVAFLSKFGWTSTDLGAGENVKLGLLRAKALSACYETPQCPIVGVVARYALSKTEGVAARFVYDGYHKPIPRDSLNLQPFQPKEETRVLFSRIFHVSVDTQLLIESMINKGDFDVSRLLPLSRDGLHYTTRYVA